MFDFRFLVCQFVSCSYFVAASMVPIYKQLLAANLNVLIYSGDVDFSVPFTGTSYWVYCTFNTFNPSLLPLKWFWLNSRWHELDPETRERLDSVVLPRPGRQASCRFRHWLPHPFEWPLFLRHYSRFWPYVRNVCLPSQFIRRVPQFKPVPAFVMFEKFIHGLPL